MSRGRYDLIEYYVRQYFYIIKAFVKCRRTRFMHIVLLCYIVLYMYI